MGEYEEYEENCKKIRENNKTLLDEFEAWLKLSGLSAKTIGGHSSNIDFYINEYLLYEDAVEADKGVDCVDMFLGYWFIKKAMWSSQANIKSNATSLKKFYTFMKEKDLINKEELEDLKQLIKEEMPEWLETMGRYDDLSVNSVW